MRITVRDREDDDLLLAALAGERRHRTGAACATSARRRRRQLRVRLGLDGAGRVRVATGAGLYDHFLEQLAFHGGLDLDRRRHAATSRPGAHHTAEDTAIAFGEALDRALGDRRGIARYGDAVVPMDDALARAAVDLGGRRGVGDRPRSSTRASRSTCSRASPTAARMMLHVEATGTDPHHVAEAAYKAVGRALRAAVRREGSLIPSTKGIL